MTLQKSEDEYSPTTMYEDFLQPFMLPMSKVLGEDHG